MSGTVNVEGDYYILDIYCQQLWNVVQLGGVCVPFGHRVGECTFFEKCICIGYNLPTIVGCCSVGGCLWVMLIFLDMCLYWINSANNCGVLFS